MFRMIALTLLMVSAPAGAEDVRSDDELRQYCAEMWGARGARERRDYVARDLDPATMETLYAGPYLELERAAERAAEVLERYFPVGHGQITEAAAGRDAAEIAELSLRISREAGRILQRAPEEGGIGLGARWYSFGHPLVRPEAANASEFYSLGEDFCLERLRSGFVTDTRDGRASDGCGASGNDLLGQLTGTGPFRNVLEPAARIAVDEATGALTVSLVVTACLTHYEGIRGWVTTLAYPPSIGEYLERTVLEACVQTVVSTGDGENVSRARTGNTITEAIQLGVAEAMRRNFAQLNGAINQGPYRWDDTLGFDPPAMYCDWMEELDRRMAVVNGRGGGI